MLSLGSLRLLSAFALKELVEGLHLLWCYSSALLSFTELQGDLDRQILAVVVVCEFFYTAGNFYGCVIRPFVVFGVFLFLFEKLHQCVFAGFKVRERLRLTCL